MKLSDLPWGMIGKVAAAALGAAGLIGTGYVAAPVKHNPETVTVERTKIIEITKEPIIIRPNIYIGKEEVRAK